MVIEESMSETLILMVSRMARESLYLIIKIVVFTKVISNVAVGMEKESILGRTKQRMKASGKTANAMEMEQ
jgi:hypothetical protein